MKEGRNVIKKSFSGSTKKRFAFKKRKLFKKKVCYFCAKKIKEIDYKDVLLFRKNITDRGKILSQRISGACAKHQRCLSKAIKRARIVGLLPFSSA
ncbi:30S ribosomal protein S18 [bacterium]|nr:30S ribosomal protein S18 [bacterium]